MVLSIQEMAVVALAVHCGVRDIQLQQDHMIFTLVKADVEVLQDHKQVLQHMQIPLSCNNKFHKTVQTLGHLALQLVVAGQAVVVIICAEHKKVAAVEAEVLVIVTVVGMTEDLALKIPGAVGLHMATVVVTVQMATTVVAVAEALAALAVIRAVAQMTLIHKPEAAVLA
jgi:hypothetical protein